MMSENTPRRLDIYMADLPRRGGSIQCGYRPVIVIQNDKGNESSSTVIIIPLTSKVKHWMPTHAIIGTHTGIEKESVALCEQIQTIHMSQLVRKVAEITEKEDVDELTRAIMSAIGIESSSVF